MTDDLRTISRCNNCKNYYTTQSACPRCKQPLHEATLSTGTPTTISTQSVKTAPIRGGKDSLPVYTPKKAKLGRKTVYKVGGEAFDSKTEAHRYIYLLGYLARGIITSLELQPQFTIRPAYQLNGMYYKRLTNGKPRTVSAEKYKADFRYLIPALNLTVIEEVKGLSKGKPYSKSASNYKQYSVQATIANRDDMLFMVVAGKSNGSQWTYFQQSRGYPELENPLAIAQESEDAA